MHEQIASATMDKKQKLQLLKQIKKEAKLSSIRDSSESKIFKYCQDADGDVILIEACCQALANLMEHFSQGRLETARMQLFDWLNKGSDKVRLSAFQALITQLGRKDPYSETLHQKIINVLLSLEQDQKLLIAELPNFNSIWDEDSQRVMIKTLQQFRLMLNVASQKPSEHFLSNGWNFIKQLSKNDLDHKSKGRMTGVVCVFLAKEMPTKLYKDILTGIAPVMEKMSSPLRLADFLTQSFEIGGAVSLMSLHGLFILMHKYNLDCPDFYEKLYSMCQPQIFGARYRSRFFHLTDTFLSSTHLPAYLVAAFVKRLARLILHAPASGVELVVIFILNLIKRHPSCEVLLHKPKITDMDSDPFLENEELSKCRALESCLWELQTLEHHYNPNISQKAKKRHIQEEDLGPFLDYSTETVIEAECKKLKKDVPTNFEPCTGFELPSPFVF